MAKVKSNTVERDVTFMTDPDINFVSLVGHAANQQPFKIMKGQVKGDGNMNKVIHSILVPKEMGTEELKDSYSFEEKDEESLDGFTIYKQVKDDEVDLETKSVAVLDQEKGIYGIVADKTEKSEAEPIVKESVDYASMDSILDGLMAMEEIVLGTLSQPASEKNERMTMINSAVTNFTNHVEAVMSTMKGDEVISLENVELKGENVKKLREIKQETPEVDIDEKMNEMKESILAKIDEIAEEKSQAKIESFKETFESMKTTLNTNLSSELDSMASKEELTSEIEALKAEIETIKNTPKTRKSVIDEDSGEPEKKTVRKSNRSITFV